jgi:hypothetical protein
MRSAQSGGAGDGKAGSPEPRLGGRAAGNARPRGSSSLHLGGQELPGRLRHSTAARPAADGEMLDSQGKHRICRRDQAASPCGRDRQPRSIP